MLKKSIFASVALVCVGIIFGVVLVSSYSGVRWGLAQDVKLGASTQPLGAENLKSISDGYVAIANEITPKVVTITVVTKATSSKNDKNLRDLFKFFSPDGEMPENDRQSSGLGSGVIISSDGYIMTNSHVIKDADETRGIKVITYDRKEYFAKLVGSDPTTELAVIKVDAKDLPVAYLGNSDEVKVGQLVFAAGNPLGLTFTITHGIISALGRNINIIENAGGYGIENFLQTDAAINPGNSGGALVDINGAVIGINTAIATGVNQSYGFAIPINLAKKVADDIIKFGKVKRGVIGVRMQGQIDETTAKALGLPKATGVLVQEVVTGSAAEEAGIKESDVILEVDGKEVDSPNKLQDIVARKHPGDMVALKLFRDGNSFNVSLKLRAANIDEEPAIAKNKNDQDESSEKSVEKNSLNFDKLGLTIRNLNSKEKKDTKVDEGVLVENTKRYGIADSRFIQKNDIILDVIYKNKTYKLNSVSDFEKLLKERKAGDAILLRVKTAASTRLVALEIPD